MVNRFSLVAVLVVVLGLTACGAGQPDTCEEIADVTVDLMQVLIDDVETELGEMTVEELIATGRDLPSVEQYREEAERIDERAVEIGCTSTEIEAGIVARVDRLESETPIGRFIIEAVRTGGL